MRALVVRSTTDSLHYDLFDLGGGEEDLLVNGRIEGIGGPNPQHNYAYGKQGRGEGSTRAENHAQAFERVAALLASPTTGVDDYTTKLTVVTHRVMHGGERFKGPARVSDEVLRAIELCNPLAPRQNPAALLGIRAARHLFPMVPHVVVFDTAFHQTMSHEAFLYAVPYELYDRVGIRRFGFHGTAHHYAVRRAARELDRPLESLRIISLHIGKESSAAAVVDGKCVDTTTGLTPSEGLPGGTTSGDIDPAAVTLLMRSEGYGPDEMDEVLLRQSGLYGLSGVSEDPNEIVDLAIKGDDRCAVAVRVFTYRAAKAVGSLFVAAGGLDALVMTGSALERSSWLRGAICDRLGPLGVVIDSFRNEATDGSKVASLAGEGSKVAIVLVPGDEQRTIARESLALVSGRDST